MDFLCLDFINSRWQATHKPFKDPMRDMEWLASFCRRWELPEITASASDIDDLLRFREDMFQMVVRFCVKGTMEPSDVDKLNEVLARERSHKMIVCREGRYLLRTVQRTDDLTWVACQVALSFARLAAELPPGRVKKCGNPECDWIFYDDSKNHTRKWCDNRCASLIKVRRHRAVRRENGGVEERAPA